MADNHFESSGEERVWDEYDWERFLQQQDRKTEKYMELLERYLDDPDRDQIIAREMGWHHLLDENGKDWTSDLDSLFSRRPDRAAAELGDEEEDEDDEEELESEEDDEDEDDDDEDESEFKDDTDDEDDPANHGPSRRHPLYQAASALTIFIDQLFDERDTAAQHPAVARLTTSATLASVKLAAALSDDDIDELGMTIAYLKRALKAITSALEATAHCEQESLLDPAQAQEVRQRIFQIRDGIVTLMGDFRTEWRRRYGHGG